VGVSPGGCGERTPLAAPGREAREATVGPVADQVATVEDVTDPVAPAATRRGVLRDRLERAGSSVASIRPSSNDL